MSRLANACVLIVLLASAARAQTGSVEGTTAYPPTPAQWLIVAFPDNWQSDPQSQEVYNGFRTDPTLIDLTKRAAVRTYTASHADWRHRWLPRVGPHYPIVILMQDREVVYKRSGATAAQVIADLTSPQLIGQWRPRPIRPRPIRPRPIRPRPDDCPNCPDDDCPYPPNDYQPDDRYPDRPGPSNPLRPISPPLIPDTVAPTPTVTPPPIIPPPPVVDNTKIDELSKRLDKVEVNVTNIQKSITGIEQSVQNISTTINNINQTKIDEVKLAAALVAAFPKPVAPVVNIDTTDIVKQLMDRSKLTVNFLDGEGKVFASAPVKDGQINIPPVSATWKRLDGTTLEQSRPLVEPLKFQTELQQVKPEGAN